jgi:hypothetical protein
MLDLATWPEGMRIIVRKERPHAGAQLLHRNRRHRFTCFAADTKPDSSLTWNCVTAALVARTVSCAPRQRPAQPSPTGIHHRNQIWREIVALFRELLAWMQMLALEGPARRWEP